MSLILAIGLQLGLGWMTRRPATVTPPPPGGNTPTYYILGF